MIRYSRASALAARCRSSRVWRWNREGVAAAAAAAAAAATPTRSLPAAVRWADAVLTSRTSTCRFASSRLLSSSPLQEDGSAEIRPGDRRQQQQHRHRQQQEQGQQNQPQRQRRQQQLRNPAIRSDYGAARGDLNGAAFGQSAGGKGGTVGTNRDFSGRRDNRQRNTRGSASSRRTRPQSAVTLSAEQHKDEIMKAFFARNRSKKNAVENSSVRRGAPTIQQETGTGSASDRHIQQQQNQLLWRSGAPRSWQTGEISPQSYKIGRVAPQVSRGSTNRVSSDSSPVPQEARPRASDLVRGRLFPSRTTNNSPLSSSKQQKSEQQTTDDLTDISRLRDALNSSKDAQRNSRTVPRPFVPPKRSKTAAFRSPSSWQLPSKNSNNTLSEFIRRIQLEQAESAKKNAEKEKNFDPLTGGSVGTSPLPQWRLASDSTRNRLRDVRQRQRQQQQQDTMKGAHFVEWGQSEHEETKKPVFVDPKDQVIILPSYGVSITEAAKIFREKTSSLRRILETIGLYDRGSSSGQGNDDKATIDLDAMELIALELGVKFERPSRRSIQNDEEILLQRRAAMEDEVVHDVHETPTPYESLTPRPPVVCIMGHVDHGKTTLMDALRRRSREHNAGKKEKKKATKAPKKEKRAHKSSDNVAGTEAGGITQVISAFQVPLSGENEAAITFLDTPGHAAFKAMRQSGSDAADIIVLVVAADDGVSSQTVEILDFYKSLVKGAGSGGISLVVAMSKIDKPGIDIKESRYKIESQLQEHGILTEGMPSSEKSAYGPPVQLIPVSGLSGEGLDDLIEGISLQSEVMDLRADDNARAEGIVMDARVDKGLGIVADCVIRWGSVSKGDVLVSGCNTGKVRLLKDTNDKPLKRGLPSQPVRIVGFEQVPKAGDPVIAVESEEIAQDLVLRRKALAAANVNSPSETDNDIELQSAGKHMMHDDWKEALETKHSLDTSDEISPIRVPVIVKADADGTLAAIRDALVQIGDETSHDIVIEPVSIGVGPVLANDIDIAKQGGAIIVCFNIKNEFAIEKLAEEEGVRLIGGNVIYSLLDDAKKEFATYLPREPFEIVHGRATVQALFDIGGIGEKVAGLQVSEGTLYKDKVEGNEGGKVSCRYRVIRGNTVISIKDLHASSLKHFRDDVEEVGHGKECGLALSGFNNFEPGDVVECFSVEMRREAL